MKKRILIVDDDPISVEPMAMLLELEGYETKLMDTHKGIFNIIDEFEPDLILIDVFLNGNDGRYICNLLKSMHKTQSIPIVLTSGVMDQQTLLNEDVCSDGFVKKPLNMDECLVMIKRLLI